MLHILCVSSVACAIIELVIVIFLIHCTDHIIAFYLDCLSLCFNINKAPVNRDGFCKGRKFL